VFEEPPSGENIPIYDDYGIYRGAYTWEEWWEITLMDSETFHEDMGDDFYTTELIYLLEESLGIDWDWEAWREQYSELNG
jgi:hypothetical protein